MSLYYLSKNYKEINSAGNKAKTDIERILKRAGYRNAGLPQTRYTNMIAGFFATLSGVLKVVFSIRRNDRVVLQYPLKKYYAFVAAMIRLKGGKVITIVHDLGSFRRKKLTIRKEIRRLNHSDCLIVHNEKMKDWLTAQGYAKPMICLGIFDYLSDSEASGRTSGTGVYRTLYAGGCSWSKNRFLYLLDGLIHHWHFVLCGNGFEEGRIRCRESFTSKGFVHPDELISETGCDFGLVWDGDSVETCSGSFGEYLKYNNPHKLSLYIRCNLPVIIWKEAALASFVAENRIGLCIGSLEELDTLLPSVSGKEYLQMKQRTKEISRKLSQGYYVMKALEKTKMI